MNGQGGNELCACFRIFISRLRCEMKTKKIHELKRCCSQLLRGAVINKSLTLITVDSRLPWQEISLRPRQRLLVLLCDNERSDVISDGHAYHQVWNAITSSLLIIRSWWIWKKSHSSCCEKISSATKGWQNDRQLHRPLACTLCSCLGSQRHDSSSCTRLRIVPQWLYKSLPR